MPAAGKPAPLGKDLLHHSSDLGQAPVRGEVEQVPKTVKHDLQTFTYI